MSTAATVGSAAYSSNQQKKAGKRAAAAQERAADSRDAALSEVIERGLLDPPEEAVFRPITQDDQRSSAQLAREVTVEALPALNQAASSINDQAIDDLKRGLDDLTGGKFAETSEASFDAVINQLSGRLSEGARQQLARQALSTGTTELGQEAVNRGFAGFIGLTAEQQVQAGLGNAAQLSSIYGSLASPRVTGAQLLPYGGLTTQTALSIEQFNRQGELGAQQFNISNAFKAQLAQADALLGTANTNAAGIAAGQTANAQAQAQAASTLANGIASGIGTLAGGFAAQGASNAGGLSSGAAQALTARDAGQPNAMISYTQNGRLNTISAAQFLEENPQFGKYSAPLAGTYDRVSNQLSRYGYSTRIY